MQFLKQVPRLIRWIFSVVLILLAVMTLFRFIFYWAYNMPGNTFPGSAFLLGLRYDARIVSVIGLSILILCAIPFLHPIKKNNAKKFWNILLPLLFVLMVFVYMADYYHFDYLHQRLNASVLNYLQESDARISKDMVGQTYPIKTIIVLLIVVAILSGFVFNRLLRRYRNEQPLRDRKRIGFYIITVLFFAQCIIGKIVVKSGQFPLRWSDAYTLSNDFNANLALNPFQSFLSTLSFRNSGYDIKKVKEYYPLMANRLGIQKPDSGLLNFERKYSVPDTVSKKPNIVLVICESFSAYKSSMYGNPLNTTPYFNELCKNGIFYDRCFTPAYGTARGVWATVTGIPDVESPSTASRNPNAVDQHTIIDDFNGYERYYFLGGDPTWANIQGLLSNNIQALHLSQKFKADNLDVWGISDKNLFLEANEVLKQQTKPFFAIIQTADNHRPYSIPTEDKEEFKNAEFSEDSLKQFGFENNKEVNAFRYTDFCYRKFIEAAKKEPYFDNTIFVFVGDHGIRGNAAGMFPKSWTEQGLTTVHVPLLFYAPKILQPKQLHEICSQVDILPSVAGLAKISYRNTTLGRNLFDTIHPFQTGPPLENYAFVFDEGIKTIGLVSNNYYYLKNLKSGKEEFVSITGNEPVPVNAQTDSIRNYLNRLTDAWYETAQYLMLNNKKVVRSR